MRSIVFALTASTALLSSIPARAACDHPYFPMKEGQTRVYRTSAGRETQWNVTKVEGSKATVETTSTFEKDKERDANAAPRSILVEVECTGDGVVLDLSKMSAEGRPGMEVKVVRHSGVTIPPASKMKAGETFDSSQTIEMTSARMKQPMQMDAKTTSKVIGIEKVKVAAGEFDAVKIESETQMTMKMPEGARRPGGPGASAGPGGAGMTMTSKGTLWVVKGIGLVKNEQVIAGMGMPGAGPRGPGAAGPGAGGATVSSELVSYSK